MNKTGRNDSCLCGSGKKYKKCCLSTVGQRQEPPVFTRPLIPEVEPGADYDTITAKYPSTALIKVLSALQLEAKNHGKNARLEALVISALNTFNDSNKPIDLGKLAQEIRKKCPRDPMEDPVEDFFTENILFTNGNNTCYPGIFIEAQEIVQRQLIALRMTRDIPAKLRMEIYQATVFLLDIHNRIAQRMGHERKTFEQSQLEDEIYFPRADQLKNNLSYITFTGNEIADICRELLIESEVIDQFVYPHTKGKPIFDHPDYNPLFEQPFLLINGEYILTIPTAQLGCINHYILKKLKEHHLLEPFSRAHAAHSASTVNAIFKKMSWERRKSDWIETFENEKLIFRDLVYQFDAEKIAYSLLLQPIPTRNPSSPKDIIKLNSDISTHLQKVTDGMRKDFPKMKIFFILVLAKADIFGFASIDQKALRGPDHSLILTIKELEVLTQNWDFDSLTLWNYSRHIEETKKEISFMPSNSHLSRFKWYQDNHEWNFPHDKAPMNQAFFAFEIEGDVNRKAKKKLDRLGIAFPAEDGMVLLTCKRTEEHLPVYLSEEYRNGIFRYCLLEGDFPIWLQGSQLGDTISSVYIVAINYWLYHCKMAMKPHLAALGNAPILITLFMDQGLYNQSLPEISEDPGKFNLVYRIKAVHRALEIEIPTAIVSHLKSHSNDGEKILMTKIYQAITALMNALSGSGILDEETIDQIISPQMPIGMQKMILLTDSAQHPTLATIGLERAREIPRNNTSHILHHQLKWLPPAIQVPSKLESPQEKVALLNELVSIHFKAITAEIARFPMVPLLFYLLRRHESIIQSREIGKISYPALAACYDQYYNVFEKFREKESQLVSTSLCIRSLIEFVITEKPTGNHLVNDADCDRVLAQMGELINCGATSDIIQFQIEDPRMGKLPSGRLGVAYISEKSQLENFRSDYHKLEFEEFRKNFDSYFQFSQQARKDKPGDNTYLDKVDGIFHKEWGITIWNLYGSAKSLCLYLFEKGQSAAILSKQEILRFFSDRSDQTEEETIAFLSILTFKDRDGVMNISPKSEAFPWRYNRRHSYIRSPLINISKNGEPGYLISPRHMVVAAENIMANFMDGTLKVDPDHKGIAKLLSDRNRIKGKRFRDLVAEWLTRNTDLQIISHEVKIRERGFFTADSDKGDVDIMAIDHQKKIIHAIEVKNTSQAKIAYDIYSEVTSYLGKDGKTGMIDKHVKRKKWLNENLTQVHTKLDLKGIYSINAFVVTKHILPTRYLRETPLPIYTLEELTALLDSEKPKAAEQ